MKTLLPLLAVLLLAGCDMPGQPPAATLTTVDQVLTGFQAAGLPIINAPVYTAETDPHQLVGHPHGPISMAQFYDSRLPDPVVPYDESLAQVELYGNVADAQARGTALDTAIQTMPTMLGEYVFQEGPLVLSLRKAYSPTQAAEYQKALKVLLHP